MEMNIDLVYLWVDGNDPKWLEKKNRFIEKKINTVGRYQDNQELKYSLRSIEKHLPWIRKIFIVTDDQTPIFLKPNHPKIEIVHHSEIIPKKFLPNFNSRVIEYFMYKIPDLSEKFLYANDDMFVNADLKPSFFFEKGIPIMRMKYYPYLKYENKIKKTFKLSLNSYRLAIENAYALIKKKYDVFYPIIQHHNIDAFLKSDFKSTVEDVFSEDIKKIFFNRFRSKTDIQRIMINCKAIATNKGILKYVNREESCRLRVHKTNYMDYIIKYNPKLFCLNDTEHATDSHRANIEPFLKKMYPRKSTFEK